MTAIRILISLTTVLLTVAALFTLGCGNRNGSEAQTGGTEAGGTARTNPTAHLLDLPEKVKRPGKPEFTLTAEDFDEEFQEDEKAYVAKYKGKYVELTGRVNHIGHFLSGDCICLNLEGTDFERRALEGRGAGPWVQCCTEDKEPWKTVLPGQTVKVRGWAVAFADYETPYLPGLLRCEILEVKGDKPPVATVAELVSQFAALDEASFKKRYHKRPLRLSGEIASFSYHDDGTIDTIYFTPRRATPFVYCYPLPQDSHEKQCKTLKVGQTITIDGALHAAYGEKSLGVSDAVLLDVKP